MTKFYYYPKPNRKPRPPRRRYGASIVIVLYFLAVGMSIYILAGGRLHF